MNAGAFSAERNGVYVAPVNAVSWQSAARAAGLGWLSADLTRTHSKRALLAALARALDFPASFGGNWDALADCLQDLSWRKESGWVIVLPGASAFAAAAPADAAILREIVATAAQHWRDRGRVFVVLVDGGAGVPPWPTS